MAPEVDKPGSIGAKGPTADELKMASAISTAYWLGVARRIKERQEKEALDNSKPGDTTPYEQV